MSRIKKIVANLENANIGFGLWICVALCIIFIRDFLEHVLSFRFIDKINSFHFVHFPAFFISILLAVIVLLHIFSRVEITKVTRVALCFFTIIILPVIVDFLILLKFGGDVSYLYITKNVTYNLVNILNPFVNTPDIPSGIRLEMAGVFILSFFYIFINRKNWLVSLIGSFLTFLACFFYISLPGIIVGWLKLFRVDDATLELMFTNGSLAQRHVSIIELFITLFLVSFWYCRYDRAKFKALLGNLRASRSLHYALLIITGFVFHFSFNFYKGGLPETFSAIRIAALFPALFFAFQFSVVINDIYDVDCDKISNRSRPLAAGTLSREEYLKVGAVYLAFALLFAFNISDTAFMIIIAFIAFYFLYSVPPLRLKRFFPLCAIIIAFQAMLAFFLGYLFLERTPTPLLISARTLWFLFLVFFLGSSVKDLKDTEGDRQSGVFTLPVLLGEERSRIAIGALVGISYLIVPFFLARIFNFNIGPVLMVITLFFAIMNYFYIKRKNAKESVIFTLYFIYTAFILSCLVIRDILYSFLIK